MRWWWVGLVVLVGAMAVAYATVQASHQRRDLDLARAEIARGQFAAALLRLEPLAASQPRWAGGGDEIDYWLGQCRWRTGRREAALEALGRVSEGGEYGRRAAMMVALALLEKGRWRAAEERLERALMRGGPGLAEVRGQLDQVYRMQARLEDAARLLRDGLDEASDPVRTLRALWRTERGTPPYETIEQALAIGERLDPSDDRIWLGRARVATQTGRLEEAESWLKRCTDARADEPVWRAWLDWARAAERPDAAGRALRAIGATRLGPTVRLRWCAWFAQRAGEPAAERKWLEDWFALEPRNPIILSRLAALATSAGEADRAAALRAAKADVDRALDAYNRTMTASDTPGGALDRLALGRLAESIGRRDDARVWYTLALRAEPDHSEARAALARLETSDRKRAPADISGTDPWEFAEGTDGASPARVAAATTTDAKPWFVDDARSAGLNFTFRNGETPSRQMPVALSGGVALLDYDGDGRLDVYAVQGGTFPPPPGAPNADRLFRNRGDGTFKDATARSGLAAFPGGYGHGAAVGDVDNDGRPDLFVARFGSYALYRNRGDGTIEDATEKWGLGGGRDWPTSAAFADLDGDGDLDLYVCHYVVWDAAIPRLCRNELTNAYMSCSPLTCSARPDHLFRNDGGRFVDVTAEAGIIDRDGRGLGVVAADFDGDGRTDLFVANDKSANYLFRNLGGFRFEEVGQTSGVAANSEGGYQAGMGVACGDLDNDGRLDLAVTNYYGESTTLYQNLGCSLFADRTAASGLGRASRLLLGFGAAFLDADADGRLDLLTANGHTDDLGEVPFRMPAQLLVGLGDGRLVDRTGSSGPSLSVPHLGRGLAVGDVDNDGRPDAVLVAQNEPLVLLHNRTERPGHWVLFRLEGRRSNRDGVGTRVTLKAGGGRHCAERIGGGSYQSANDPRLAFGLGPATWIDEVEVKWPSGQVDRFRDLEIDRIYRLREGDLTPASSDHGS
jgi:tetratricopeptide (TPR) repeat protein